MFFNSKKQLLTVSLFGSLLATQQVYADDYVFTLLDGIPRGINNNGTVVGNQNSHGFVFGGNNYTLLDVPGSSYTMAWGIT